ncbi:nucleoside triphosphatase YtkD [Bacillus sp. FJAT-29790]|uniref:RNA deprotection pyrophosphohydrolase n=1 Tax=Bacillus sp. FJAT-29790 TaxID=1895002 RepID=UPI001C2127A0|nr:nucleoside triphosphatase YtkD [Bacillus sp. FJAT-29790]MBU8879851.1 nucleoside triphosphatase YtkD [Bacillus sp. FJAT-29790]
METFFDENGGIVSLSFAKNSFDKQPEHVLVICKMGKNWLLTNHKKRGLEFPGGKVERGETLKDAAYREVFEETGASISRLQFIGEYQVSNNGVTFVKAIFFGQVDKIEDKEHYLETAGPVLIDGNLLELRWGKDYSFIMKDQVVEKSMNRILELE